MTHDEPTIEHYRRMLRVSKHTIDDELEIQGDHMERINAQVVKANTRSIEAKEHLARTEARLKDEIREAAEKITVDQLDSRMRRATERVKAFDRWVEAREEHELWQGMAESWRIRGFSLRELTALHGQQYFAVSSNHVGKRQERRDSDNSEGRRAIRLASTETPRRRPT